MINNLGIPYMGSKRKLATKILEHIIKNNPNAKHFYDLFGGGASVSLIALQYNQFENVYYNELNIGVYKLLEDIKNNGVTEKYYQWIDRLTFKQKRNYGDWIGGLIKTCWSFGNNQIDYLYGKDLEQYKYWYHKVIIDNIDYTKEMGNYCEQYVLNKYNVKQKYSLRMPTSTNYQDRRLEIRQQLSIFESQLKQIEHLGHLRHLERLQHLERLEHLERLKHLEHLERLIITNLSYENVIITTPIDETIIYLDPPYKGTRKYQEKIDHDALYEWFKSSPYKIYMSGYDCPFEVVDSYKHNTSVTRKKENQTLENLYCNKKETIIEDIFY